MKKLVLLPVLLLLTGCTTEQELEITTDVTQIIEEITTDAEETDTVSMDIGSEVVLSDLVEELGLDLTATFGSEGALVDHEFTIDEMLTYALEDELRARAEYEFVIETFEVANPFTSIKASEETHINLLLPLFETYQVPMVDGDVTDELLPATTLKETYEVGVLAEILNIEMYNMFLTQDLPSDLESAFIQLRDASENHLAAFERQLARYE